MPNYRNRAFWHLSGIEHSSVADRRQAVRGELYRYANAKLALTRQTVACNCFHVVEARLARCVLMTRDRVLRRNQAFLAQMLGVRRGTVNESAGLARQAGGPFLSSPRRSIRSSGLSVRRGLTP